MQAQTQFNVGTPLSTLIVHCTWKPVTALQCQTPMGFPVTALQCQTPTGCSELIALLISTADFFRYFLYNFIFNCFMMRALVHT